MPRSFDCRELIGHLASWLLFPGLALDFVMLGLLGSLPRLVKILLTVPSIIGVILLVIYLVTSKSQYRTPQSPTKPGSRSQAGSAKAGQGDQR